MTAPVGRTAAAWAASRSRAVQAVRELLLAGRRRTRTVMLARGLDPAPIVEHIVELAREQRAAVREVSRSELDATARTEAPQGVVALADPLPESDLVELVEPHGGLVAQAGPLPEAGAAAPIGAPEGVVARADRLPEVGAAEPVESPVADSARRAGQRAGAPFLLVLDGITDPGNFGAVLRTAESAGVTGVVLPRHRSARITPTVAKAAAGAVEHLRFAVVPRHPVGAAHAEQPRRVDGRTRRRRTPPAARARPVGRAGGPRARRRGPGPVPARRPTLPTCSPPSRCEARSDPSTSPPQPQSPASK